MPSPSPTPEPSPSPTPTPTPTPEEEDADPGAWWHHVHLDPAPGELYTRNAPPGARGRSPAGSVAVAIAMASPRDRDGHPSLALGQRATLEAACRFLGAARGADVGCTRGDNTTNLYQRERGQTTSRPRPSRTTTRRGRRSLLSAAIEPLVHAAARDLLVCASPELCAATDDGATDHCARCDASGQFQGRATGNAVLRGVEAGLGVAKGARKSRAVPECVRSAACVAEVAEEVAVAAGARSALPLTARVEAVATANGALLDGARAEFAHVDGRPWLEREAARLALLRAHREAVDAAAAASAQTPARDVIAVVNPALLRAHASGGRRLAEVREAAAGAARAQVALTPLQQEMKAQTNITCHELAVKNRSMAHASHVAATRLWVRMAGGGNDAKGKGRVCVDCQFPDATVACRLHFAMAARTLVKLRTEAEAPPDTEEVHEERKRRLKEHARAKLGEACCARFPDGHVECGERFCEIHMRKEAMKRVADVARRMSEAQHPKAVEHFGVATQMGIDMLNPALHPDEECRNRPANATIGVGSGGVEDVMGGVECMGRSLLHHLSVKHGLSYDGVKAKLDDMGISLGEGLLKAARMSGKVRERTSAGGAAHRSAFEKQRASDERTASDLMEASRARRRAGIKREGAGRKLQEAGVPRHYEARDLGAHAQEAGAMRAHLRNASTIVHGRLMAIDHAATAANNRHSRVGAHLSRRGTVPRPHNLEWHSAKQTFSGPMTAMLALSAEEGSIASRFGGAVRGLNALRDRTSSALTTTRRRLAAQEHQRSRKLAARDDGHADRVYARLEERLQVARLRRLTSAEAPPQARRGPLELPERHALSWVHELVDWHEVVGHAEHLYGVTRRRLAEREKGHLTHEEIVRKHPTGWKWLDRPHHTAPTVLGDAVRRVLYRKETGKEPPWHDVAGVHARVRRRLSEEQSRSGLRQLAVAFMEGTIAAPFALYDRVLPNGIVSQASGISIWEMLLRYIVSSTVGCYFVKPQKNPVTTMGGLPFGADGDGLKVLRPTEEKLCFPAVRSNQTPTRPPARPPTRPPTRPPVAPGCARLRVPACRTPGRPRLPAHRFRSRFRSSSAFARSPTPRASTSSRSRTRRCARTTASCRPLPSGWTATASASEPTTTTPSCPTRPSCAPPRPPTPSGTLAAAGRPRPTPARAASSCARLCRWAA